MKQKPFDQNAGHWTAAGHFSVRGNFGFFSAAAASHHCQIFH